MILSHVKMVFEFGRRMAYFKNDADITGRK